MIMNSHEKLPAVPSWRSSVTDAQYAKIKFFLDLKRINPNRLTLIGSSSGQVELGFDIETVERFYSNATRANLLIEGSELKIMTFDDSGLILEIHEIGIPNVN